MDDFGERDMSMRPASGVDHRGEQTIDKPWSPPSSGTPQDEVDLDRTEREKTVASHSNEIHFTQTVA